MSISVPVVSALLVAIFGAVGSIWAIVRDREKLRLLERVSVVLSLLDESSVAHAPMTAMQEEIAVSVLAEYLARQKRRPHFLVAIALFLTAFFVIVSSIAVRTSVAGSALPTAIGLWAGIALLLVGLVVYLQSVVVLRGIVKAGNEASLANQLRVAKATKDSSSAPRQKVSRRRGR